MEKWYTISSLEAAEKLNSSEAAGLNALEAAHRLAETGPNELKERGVKSSWRILWEQLTSSMVVILLVAALISFFLGERKDTIAILVIVVLNALLGFRQEYKAEKAVTALKALAIPSVRVVREGSVQEISARELVPGDVILLEAGNVVPADARLLESINLGIQEAALTGESEPVEKDAHTILEGDLSLADRRNMVYMGTAVATGRGRALVTETGMDSELGHIAQRIQELKKELTPLQRKLNRLGRVLAAAALLLVVMIFFTGLMRGGDVKEMLLVAISMAVAAVPEGLPAVVTIALALGSQRMLKRHALIRKLPAVETLGSVTVICSDKTGTLTQNRMAVTILDALDHQLDFQSSLDRATPSDEMSERQAAVLKDISPSLLLLLAAGALCNDAVFGSDREDRKGEFHIVGDPTEAALVLAAAQAGLSKPELEASMPRVGEVPFDSSRKRMTTLHHLSGPEARWSPSSMFHLPTEATAHSQNTSYVALTKGAVDSLMEVCSGVLTDGHIETMNEGHLQHILDANSRLAGNGMRVLGVAFRPLRSLAVQMSEAAVERGLIFIGMIGMMDPARPEVRGAVTTCKAAGIRPIMITGDHPLTARYIARDLGITAEDRVLTGAELEGLSSSELERMVEEISVYARVSPEHKLQIVSALQKRNQIVAMTGDGVNDAPALKKADIGVAMGIAGTDVTREVADMVLLDDNFATIVQAVEEGRVIYDNIRRVIKYLLSTNSGELWVMLLAPFLGMPLPLYPLQILWINLVTDGLPALALGVEPAEPDVMRRPPHHPGENILGGRMGLHILWVGLLVGLIPLLAGYRTWRHGNTGWQTMVFTILTFAQMSQALAVRSERHSLFSIGVFSNKFLLGAVLLTFALQLAVVYVPFFQQIFRTVGLPAGEMILCIGLGTLVFWGVEMEKWLTRRSAK